MEKGDGQLLKNGTEESSTQRPAHDGQHNKDTSAKGKGKNKQHGMEELDQRSMATIHQNAVQRVNSKRDHWRIQGGGARDARPPPGGPNSFIFMQFSAKN